MAEDPAFGKPAFLKAKSLHVGVEIWPFLHLAQSGGHGSDIDQPEIALVQAPSGDWNFSSLGGKSRAASPGRWPAAGFGAHAAGSFSEARKGQQRPLDVCAEPSATGSRWCWSR